VLRLQVLTTGSWPTQAASKCVLPVQLEAACEAFKDFYTTAHNGRRLTWQTNMGTADLKATFNNGKAKHEITVRMLLAQGMHVVCF
jgi:cullin 3